MAFQIVVPRWIVHPSVHRSDHYGHAEAMDGRRGERRDGRRLVNEIDLTGSDEAPDHPGLKSLVDEVQKRSRN